MALQYRLAALSGNARILLTPLSQFAAVHHHHGCASLHVSDILQGHERRPSSYTRNHNGIRAYCTGEDLSVKKCVPCNSKDLRPMTEGAASKLLQQVPGWNLVHEGGIQKLHSSWKVKTFLKGMELLRLVADVAEAEGHHPDLHLIGWNNVKIDIWTHAVGGLTENDFILAAKINGLQFHHLLRIPASI